MILGALARYADERLQQPPQMYIYKNVRYIVELDSSGNCNGITEPVSDASSTGNGARGRRSRTAVRGATLAVPRLAINRSSTRPKPLLLADNGEYALCVAREGVDEARVSERHESFVRLLSECYGSTASEDVGAVLAFLDKLAGGTGDPVSPSAASPDEAYANLSRWSLLPEEYDPRATVTFRVEGRLPVEEQAVRRFWANYTEDESLPYGRCYVSGEVRRLVRRMPGGVRGIPGSQPSGAKLVAINRDAFESYGLGNALNCPVSREEAIKVDAALNSLVSDPEKSLTVGDTIYTFFALSGAADSGTRAPEADDVASTDSGSLARELIARPTEEALGSLLSSIYSGERLSEDGDAADKILFSSEELYCLALSANSSRLIVKKFLKAPASEIFNSLRRWFAAQRIINADGAEVAAGRGIFGLIGATLPAGEGLSERLARVPSEADTYVSAAISGGPLPHQVFPAVLRRIRKERSVGTPQAQLLKLALTAKGMVAVRDLQELTDVPNLEGADRQAYFLGRLMATLESIQIGAQGRRVNSNLVDRYYAMASTNPARGFAGPQSLVYRAHLPSLRRRRPGLYNILNGQLESIHAELALPLPASFSVERQGLFAIGYYHQSAYNRRQATSRRRLAGAEPT